MKKYARSQLILNMIKTKLVCENLTTIVEEKTSIILDLNDQYIYFEIEIINSFYRLTKTVFSNTLEKQSEIIINFDCIAQVNEYIINATLRANKIKGIPCKKI